MRRIVLAVAAAVALPAMPAASYDPCTAGYPDPAISVQQSANDVKPGEPVWMGGRLARNGCGIGSVRVGLFVRDRAGAFRWVASAVTTSRGEYTFMRRPQASFDAMVVFSGSPSQRRAVSQIHHVTVSSVDTDDGSGYGGCEDRMPLKPRWTAPRGWQLELVGVPPRLRTGYGAEVLFKVTNNSDREIRFTSLVNGTKRFVLLQDVRTGERPNGVSFTDFSMGREHRLRPGESTTIRGGFRAAHCHYGWIHPRHMRTVAWLDISLRDEEQNIEQRVAWYAPPVPIEITR